MTSLGSFLGNEPINKLSAKNHFTMSKVIATAKDDDKHKVEHNFFCKSL